MVDNQSVDEICSRIRKDGEREVNSILDKAEKTASEIIEKAEEEKDRIIKEIIAEAEQKGETERRRELSGVQIEIKRAKLKIREDVIANVMEKVKESLEKVREESSYPVILKDMIVEGIKALDGKSFFVLVDGRDFHIMKKEVIPAVRAELKGELENVEIRELEEDSLGGVKVGVPGGNVVYDNRFEARMYRLRDDIRNMIFENIFRSEGGEG
ncbi:MAG: V-type ATP synthase subunit E family protein [Candidatus Krumholzibacteriota bacterium]|nr:V-type ATP synthase subunit E family protein [Candidatus Krumholzibacteriota bacterium]